MASETVQSLLEPCREAILFPVFSRFAGPDGAMSQADFIGLLEAGGLIDDKLTGRECKAMFVRVNLDDDLGTEVTADEDGNVWEQVEEGAATHSSSVMEYDEFEEVMARIANEKRGGGGEWAGSDEELAALLVAFAEEAIAPLKR